MFAEFKTLPQLFDFFKDEETCLAYWENIHWHNTGIICPHCKAGNPYKTNRGYKCRNKECQKKFSALVGTIFENTKLPLRTWFGAIFLCVNHKKGVSSLQLGRDLGIHPKSAWYLLHRIRETIMERTPQALGGNGNIVEADITVVGGKTKNMSNKKRKEIQDRKRGSWENKTHMAGYIERNGNIRFDVVEEHETETGLIKKNVDTDSLIMTDTASNMRKVGQDYLFHGTVDHSKNEYVKEAIIHTNTIEGAFSHFDRMIVGVYHNISRKHMQAYANECAYRYNTRKMEQPVRFEDAVMKCSGVSLKYNTLTSK